MKAEVIRITREGSCSARTENELLLVFRCPDQPEMLIGDELTFGELVLDGAITARHAPSGADFLVRAEIHDLRLPAAHGSSRTPSPTRLHGA